MSSIEMKNSRTDSYQLMSAPREEIDLLSLASTLFAARNMIISVTLMFALCGLAASFLLPQKWTSKAIVTPPENEQLIELRRATVNLSVLDVATNFDAQSIYNLFLKKFDSQNLRERFLTNSPYVQALINNADVDKSELYRAIVNTSERFTSVDNSDPKKPENNTYSSRTFSFTAPDARDAQQVLQNYINFIAAEVNKDVLQNLKNALDLKIAFDKDKLALDRIILDNQHNTNIQRLGYSLKVANAAGIKRPVYSNGQAMRDDPDYSVALGSDGLSEKLKIEQSIKDASEMNASILNREHILKELEGISISDIDFAPFKYQMQPSLPIKKDGAGKSLIILLAAMIGGILACGVALARAAMASRMRLEPIL